MKLAIKIENKKIIIGKDFEGMKEEERTGLIKELRKIVRQLEKQQDE